ncbi:putative protein FAM111A-like, partial [Triplophysa rosa]
LIFFQASIDEVPKKEVEEVPSKDQQKDKEEKAFKYRLNSDSKTYAVQCDPSMTVLDALNTSRVFKQEKEILKNKDKQTDFPCCLIDNDEIIDVNFIQNDGSASTNQNTNPPLSSNPDMFVIFYIKKRGGKNMVNYLENTALRDSINYVCVYARKGETLKTALEHDGRFDKVFEKHCVLTDGGNNNYEMSHSVNHLDQKEFEVTVLKGAKQPKSQDDLTSPVKTEPEVASDADDADTRQTLVNTEQKTKQKKIPVKSTRPSARWSAPKEMPDSGEILKLLREQHAGLLEQLKKRENLKNKLQVQNFFKEEFAKSVQSFLEVKIVKMLAELSDAVCQIRVEGRPEGTGFLLFDRYVLTNAHVIEPFASCIQVDPYPLIQLQKTVTTVFNFEDHQSKQLIEVSVNKEVFAVAKGRDSKGRHLDYALLELEIDVTNNTKLLSFHSYSPPRAGSQICIVGHPGEGVKKVDPCFIIKRETTQDTINDPFHVISQQYLENMEVNQIPYDSCFFNGSSGSPVFDEHCYLIGIHTGGFSDKEKGSILEYAYSLEAILEDIKIKVENKEENIRNTILSILEEHGNISDSYTAEHQNQALNISIELDTSSTLFLFCF